MIYRVHVDCWYTAKPKPICERRIFIVEADNIDAAQHRGTVYAEETAACSHHLSAVEWRSTEPVLLPAEVVGGASFGQSSAFRNLREPKPNRAARRARNGKGACIK